MSKDDVIDKDLASRFAWRTSVVEPSDSPPRDEDSNADEDEDEDGDDDEDEDEDEDDDEDADPERWQRAQQGAAEIAREVARVWDLTPREAQAAATATLIQRARRLPDALVCMSDHPIASIRLWRLVVRHYRRMPARVRKKHVYALVFLSPPLDQPEMAELLFEVASSRASSLVVIMSGYLEREGQVPRHPVVTERLARIVAEGKTWAARENAAMWLAPSDVEAALPALRRAVRQPRLRLRWRALALLLEHDPLPLSADDIQWLLDDVEKHPLPEAHGDHAKAVANGYAEALLRAVTRAPPSDGWAVLGRIADRPKSWEEHEIEGVNAHWALRVLAAAYPERALTRIDRRLLDDLFGHETEVIEAVSLLPADLARPRLLAAAARPHHELAERAKVIWFERFGQACPVAPLEGVPLSVLAGAPSDRLLAWVTVLRGSSEDARRAILETVLAEAPMAPPETLSAAHREVLAILLFVARDRRGSCLPLVPREHVAQLFARFGSAAFPGLWALAAQDARAGRDHMWLGELISHVEKHGATDDERERMRELARIGLNSPSWEGAIEPVRLLSATGIPADLEAPLVALITAKDAFIVGTRHFTTAYIAGVLLARTTDLPGFDERLVASACEAYEARAWDAFGALAAVGCRRRVPTLLRMTEQVIAGLGDDSVEQGAMRGAVGALHETGAFDEEWLIEVLRCPESPGFTTAVCLVGKKSSRTVLDALHRALESVARAGAAAAEAAEVLFAIGELSVDDRRLDGILERAPMEARADLVGRLLFCGAPLSAFRRHVVELLVLPEEGIVAPLVSHLVETQPEETTELFEDALPFATCSKAIAMMEEALGEPPEAETYWQERDDPDGGLDEGADGPA